MDSNKYVWIVDGRIIVTKDKDLHQMVEKIISEFKSH